MLLQVNNVVELVQHKSKGLQRANFQSLFNEVSKEAYFATLRFFTSVGTHLATTLNDRRGVFKILMEAAAENNNKDLVKYYDNLQKSCKALGNAQYGILVREVPIVGGCIAQVGRNQNEAVASHMFSNGMAVINADTDSVMPADKSMTLYPASWDRTFDHQNVHPGALTVTYNTLCTDTVRSKAYRKVSTIVKSLINKYKQVTHVLNNGIVDRDKSTPDCTVYIQDPAYKKPCSLEFEKTYCYKMFWGKKVYFALKIQPDLSLEYHVAGLTGIKSDKTLIKTLIQTVPTIMLGEGDYEGCLTLLSMLFHFGTITLRAVEISEEPIKRMCSTMSRAIDELDNIPLDNETYIKIREDNGVISKDLNRDDILQRKKDSKKAREDMVRFDEENKEEEIFMSMGGDKNLLPKKYLMAVAKVGDLCNNTFSSPTLKQIRECKRKGIPFAKAPKEITVFQRGSVQVGQPTVKFCETLMKSRVTIADLKHDVERSWFATEEEFNKFLAQRERREATRAVRDNATKPTTVTGMPCEYLVSEDDRADIPRDIWVALIELHRYATIINATIERERKKDFHRDSMLYDLPAFMTSSNSTFILRSKERLNSLTRSLERVLCDGFTMQPYHLPIWWYDANICISQFSDFEVSFCYSTNKVTRICQQPPPEDNRWKDALQKVKDYVNSHTEAWPLRCCTWYMTAHEESCIDFHQLRRDQKKTFKKDTPIYVLVTVARDLPAFLTTITRDQFQSISSDVEKNNIIHPEEYTLLLEKPRRVTDTVAAYYIDMEDFDSQTRSTPYLITSPDKQRYITVRAGFKEGRRNTFNFETSGEFLTDISSCNWYAFAFTPEYETNSVKIREVNSKGRIGSEFSYIQVQYKRDDRRPVTHWDLDTKTRVIRKAELLSMLRTNAGTYQTHNSTNRVRFAFNDTDMKVRIYPNTVHDIAFIPICADDFRVAFYHREADPMTELLVGENQNDLGPYVTRAIPHAVKERHKKEQSPKAELNDPNQKKIDFFVISSHRIQRKRKTEDPFDVVTSQKSPPNRRKRCRRYEDKTLENFMSKFLLRK